MTNTQTVNGIQITPTQLAQLSAKGVNISQLGSMSSLQLSSLLSGLSANNFGALTTGGNNNMLATLLSGNAVGSATPTQSTGLMGGTNMSAAQAIAMFEQMSGGYLTQSGLDLSGIMSQNGGYNFAAVNLTGMSRDDQKVVQNMSFASMGLSVLSNLFGASNANGLNPLAQEAFSLVKSLLTPSEMSNNSVVADANNGIPSVNTGLLSGLDNAIKSINSTGKINDGVKNQLSAAKSSIGTLDSQISTLENEVTRLSNMESLAETTIEEMNTEVGKINDPAKQQKIEQYQSIEAQYMDTQATADKLKGDYEMTPDTIIDENGKTVKNPQKEVIKEQYEEQQKVANELKKQRDALKTEMDKDPQLKSVADKTDNICQFYSNYVMKKGELKNKKIFRKDLAEKTNTLEQLIAQKSGGTSTD